MSEDQFRNALELAWGLIANASGGDWTKESAEWQKAAERWRDEQYHPSIEQAASSLQVATPVVWGADMARHEFIEEARRFRGLWFTRRDDLGATMWTVTYLDAQNEYRETLEYDSWRDAIDEARAK